MSLFTAVGSSWMRYGPTARLIRIDLISAISDENPIATLSMKDGTFVRIREVDWINDGDYTTFEDLLDDITTKFVPVVGGGTFDPSLHSVTEFNDVTNAGSGAIITNAERNQITTNQTDISALTSSYNRRQKVIDIANSTLVPPTEVLGDRYIIDFTVGTINAAWDSATKGDIAEFNGSVWIGTTPSEGWISYVDTQNKDALYVNDGVPNWEIREIVTTDASGISVVPTGNLSSTDTQAALEELQGDIDSLNISIHDTLTLGGVVSDTTDDTLNLSGQVITVNLATTSTDGAMSSTDKTKIDGIETGANDYTLTLGGVVSDTTDDTLNLSGQVITVNLATTSTDGAMSSTDKTKIDGIETGANDYTLTLGGVVSDTTDDTLNLSGQVITVNLATTSTDGAMSSTDKTKLNEIEAGANDYSHPNHSGDVTSTGDGATVISPDVVTNSKAANMAANTLKGNNTGSVSDPKDLTISEVRNMLKPEEFYLERIETINEGSSTPKEYFTHSQNGTEINNVVSAIGGTYHMSISFVCRNTSSSGDVVVEPKIGGNSVFVQPHRVEPDSGNNTFYVNITKRVTLAAGNNTITLELRNIDSGTARIYEANVTLTQIL